MRTTLALILLLIGIIVFGQTNKDWESTSWDEFYQLSEDTVSDLITGQSIEAFNVILSMRDYSCFNIDTADFDIIHIIEYYNPTDNSFDFLDRRYRLQDSLCYWQTRHGWSKGWQVFNLIDQYGDVDQINLDLAMVDSVKPRDYYYHENCTITKRKTWKAKRLKNKIESKNDEIEDYYLLNTWIDKKAKSIKISFRVPVYGQRNLEVFFCPVGGPRRPTPRDWYYDQF